MGPRDPIFVRCSQCGFVSPSTLIWSCPVTCHLRLDNYQHPHPAPCPYACPFSLFCSQCSHLTEQELDCVMPCLGLSLDANSSWPCHLWPTTDLFYKSVSPASLWLLNEPCLSQLKVRVLTIPSTQTALLQRPLSGSCYQIWPQLIFAIPSERASSTPPSD